MARISLVVALLLVSGCGGKLAAENETLKADNASLAKKVVALEAENARLRQQIEFLTKTVDDLSNVQKTQDAASRGQK